MSRSQTLVSTTSASRYLRQLCKHWSHKFAVEFTPENGFIPLADGRVCRLAATPETLTIEAEALDGATLERLQHVIIDHIKRFAFREDFGDIRWTSLN